MEDFVNRRANRNDMAWHPLLQEGSLQHAFVGTLSTSSLTHSRCTMNKNSLFLSKQSTDCCCLFDLEFGLFCCLAFQRSCKKLLSNSHSRLQEGSLSHSCTMNETFDNLVLSLFFLQPLTRIQDGSIVCKYNI